ncbi:hypothetical protein D9M71_744370 [compost metagenome]
MLGGFHCRHHPVVSALGVVVPEHLGVAEVGGVAVQNGVAGVLRPGLAVVQAECQRLGLQAAMRGSFLVGAGVNGDQGRVLESAESRAVARIHDNAAGEDVFLRVGGDGQRLLFPVEKIL